VLKLRVSDTLFYQLPTLMYLEAALKWVPLIVEPSATTIFSEPCSFVFLLPLDFKSKLLIYCQMIHIIILYTIEPF